MIVEYKIDLDSVRINPHAGQTYIDISNTSNQYILEIENGQMSKYLAIPNWEKAQCIYKGPTDEPDGIKYITEHDVQRLFTLSPEPKWLYKYKPFKGVCECGNVISEDDESSYDYYHGGDYYGESFHCKCGEPLNFAYENIKDVVNEIHG